MKSSIIINTYNRAVQLQQCLTSLRHLEGDFEVIVVNGPSTDETKEVCKIFKKNIKYIECEERNLSISRNIGIAAASGEIVAFIDDDALVHPKWLINILDRYDRPNIAAVGGFTIDHTGRQLQAATTLCDRNGNSFSVGRAIPTELFCAQESSLYPSLLGTNSTFKVSELEKIGGFDETYAYFLDETDVCLRIIESGGEIVYSPSAFIYHRYAASHLRNTNKVPTTLLTQARSKSYFIFRHGAKFFGESKANLAVQYYQESLRNDNKWLREHGYLTPSAEHILNSEVSFGIEEGRNLARKPASTNLMQRRKQIKLDVFKPFKKSKSEILSIVFVTQGFPPSDTNGIARWTEQLARELSKRGHLVRIISRASESSSTDFQNGYWIHRIKCSEDAVSSALQGINIPKNILDWSTSVYTELQRIGFENIDIISAPVWDLEGLVATLLAPVPVVTSLHTTYALAKPYKPDWQRPLFSYRHVDRVIEGEKFIINFSNFILGNSSAIVSELEAVYDLKMANKTIVVPHGVDIVTNRKTQKISKHFTVLFVGRQESRKGFDVAIRAAIMSCKQNSSIKFRFIGQETQDEKSKSEILALEEEAATINCRITIEGHVSDEVLSEAYSTCDVFICPSRYESFGLVALEAMRYGKPVIAGARGGLAEVITKDTGFLIDPESPNELCEKILLLESNRSLAAKLGNAGLRRFLTEYSAEKMAISVEHAFKKFISCHHLNDKGI